MRSYTSIILLSSFTLLCAKAEDTYKEQCKLFQTNNCSCTAMFDRFEFLCPVEPVIVAVTMLPKTKSITIDCMEHVDWDIQNLPSIQLGSVKYLTIKQCPFPSSSFSDIMKRLGITSINILQFRDSSHVKNNTLTSSLLDGLENLQKLSFDSNNMERIDKNAFEALTELIELEIKFNNVNLMDGLFNHLRKLKSLDLTGNGLSSLPLEIFENLTELVELSLRSNNMTYIESGTLKDLVHLNLLELSCNKLNNITEDAFSDLKNLEILSLAENNLQYVPEKLFMNTQSISTIYMYRNPDLILPDNLFSNLTKLENVELNECKIKHLPDRLFDGSFNIKHIILRMNELEKIPNFIFKDLKKLENLDLSYNKLNELPEQVFHTTTNLTTLNLANNLLTQVRETFFNSLYKLKILNLENNRISAIETYSFRKLANLNEILLAHNYIDLNNQEIAPFSFNKALEKIDLSHNNVTRITADVAQTLVHLKEIDLSYNQIPYIQFNDILTTSYPIKINLSYNKITRIDFTNAVEENDNNFDMDGLKDGGRTVYLDGNPIKCNCHLNSFIEFLDFIKQDKIQSLVTLDVNNLNCASPEEYSEHSIKDITLNMLTCSPEELGTEVEIPDNCKSYEFRPWDRSLIIDCKDANLTKAPVLHLPDTDKYDQVEVHLEGNQLVSAPIENMGYDNVTRLYLSYNNIRDVAWVPPNIQILELHNNNISHINSFILSALNESSFTNLTLGNNPWTCDCSTVNLTNFLTSNVAHKKIDIENVKCRDSGKRIFGQNIEEICPNGDILKYILPICILVLFFFVLYILYCKFKQEIKVWLYAHDVFLWFVEEDELDKDKKYDAFVSYSHQDEEFVLKQLQPVLENSSNPFKLCLHIRDFIPGEFISKQIVDCVTNSRRTIVILSRSFLDSEWGKMEFRIAHQQALEEKRAKVILVLYDDIDLQTDLDDEFKAYIKTNTYVKWGDPWFWDKLRYALPHMQRNKKPKKHNNVLMAMRKTIGRIGDKMELIHSPPTTPNPASTPPVLNLDPLLLKKSPLDFTPAEV